MTVSVEYLKYKHENMRGTHLKSQTLMCLPIINTEEIWTGGYLGITGQVA